MTFLGDYTVPIPLLGRLAEALMVPENVGSWRVAENAGMRFEGTATYYDIPDLKKYVAEREWWGPPQVNP